LFFHQNYCFSLPWQRPQRKKYLQQRQTLKEKNKIFAFSITTKLPFVMKQNGQYYSMNTVIKEKFPMPNFLSQNNHSIEIVSVFQNLMLHTVLEHVAIFPYCLTSFRYSILYLSILIFRDLEKLSQSKKNQTNNQKLHFCPT